MKLNVKNIRYLTSDDWRVLTAVCAPPPSLQRNGGELTLIKDHDRQKWAAGTMKSSLHP